MTRQALEKLEGTSYKAALEYKKARRKQYSEMGWEKTADEIKASIAGYLKAMRDCGVISERERQYLFIYYAAV